MTERRREGGAAIVGVDTAQGACKTGVTSSVAACPYMEHMGAWPVSTRARVQLVSKLVVVKARKSVVGRDGRDGRGAVKLDPIMATRSVGGHLIACEGVEAMGR
jgi:hypothetical protein